MLEILLLNYILLSDNKSECGSNKNVTESGHPEIELQCVL